VSIPRSGYAPNALAQAQRSLLRKTGRNVYDVAWGDADLRQPGADGKLPAVGNTVDAHNPLLDWGKRRPELVIGGERTHPSGKTGRAGQLSIVPQS
jgi:hypothetical protein